VLKLESIRQSNTNMETILNSRPDIGAWWRGIA
jgi:hypothetical protein